MKTPNPEIFLEAAQNVDDGSEFSCCTVGLISKWWYKSHVINNGARKWYEKNIVCLEKGKHYNIMFANRQERVLALLFAYHIAMDEKGQFEMPVDETEEKINQIVKIGAELGLNCVILKNFIQSQIENKQTYFDDLIAGGHNPQCLTNKEVGVKDGWRLLTEEEIHFRNKNHKNLHSHNIEMVFIWNGKFKSWHKNACGNVINYIYRTKMPKDYFLSNAE